MTRDELYGEFYDADGNPRPDMPIWIQKPILNPRLRGRFHIESVSDFDLLPWRPESGEIVTLPDRIDDGVQASSWIGLEDAITMRSNRFFLNDLVERGLITLTAPRPTHTPATQLPLFIPPVLTGTKVYFQTDGEAIKIGRTDVTAESRRRAHQTGNPRTLTTLIVIPGASERRLHARFDQHRIPGRREWFRMVPEIMNFIAAWQLVEGAFD